MTEKQPALQFAAPAGAISMSFKLFTEVDGEKTLHSEGDVPVVNGAATVPCPRGAMVAYQMSWGFGAGSVAEAVSVSGNAQGYER